MTPLCTGHAGASTIKLTPERAGHAATRLKSGQVLITGGVNESATLTSALLYNLTTGTLTPTGNMNSARASHTSTLLNGGTVLISGGGFTKGDMSSFLESVTVARDLQAAGYLAISIQYRLARGRAASTLVTNCVCSLRKTAVSRLPLPIS